MGNVLKRYNGTNWEAVGGAVVGTVNEYTESSSQAYACDYINGLQTYSTTEQVVGTWTDGKPIYRKVIDITDTKTASASYSKQIDLSSLNIDLLVKTDYEFWHGNQNWVNTNIEIGNYYMSSSDYCRLFRSKSSTYDRYNFSCFVNEQNVRLIIILEYTKTTD